MGNENSYFSEAFFPYYQQIRLFYIILILTIMENEAKLTEMNGRLRKLYEPYLQFLNKEFSNFAGKISLPLLMKVSPSYFKATHKILFIGKEIIEDFGTISESSKFTPDYLMEAHEKFDLQNTPHSPFWDFVHVLNERINGDPCNGFTWTSFSKFSFNHTTPPVGIQNKNLRSFELLREELSILQPDIVIFLTGYSYDEQLKHVFNGIKYSSLMDNVLYRVSHEYLPENTLIALHPKALIERSISETVMEAILKEMPVVMESE